MSVSLNQRLQGSGEASQRLEQEPALTDSMTNMHMVSNMQQPQMVVNEAL